MLFDNIGSTTRAEQKLQSQPLCLSHIFKSCPGAGSRKGRQHIRSCLPALDVGAVDVSLFVACQDASQRFFHRFAISSRQRPEFADN